MIWLLTAFAFAGDEQRCDELFKRFDHFSKEMAFIDAEGFMDDSGNRANMRNNKLGYLSTQQNMLLSLSTTMGCVLPALLPMFIDYRPHALACALSSELKSDAAEEDCDLSKWKSEKGL